MKLYIGTYTKRDSKGIYEVDLENGLLKNVRNVIETSNPTYLDWDSDTKQLYAVTKDGDKGGVGVWNEVDDSFEFDTSYMVDGAPPCYVRLRPETNEIMVANYHLGKVFVYNRNNSILFDYGMGSHPHFVKEDLNNEYVYVCDLGKDKVHRYKDWLEVGVYKTANGMGPRHLEFNKKLPILYVFGELNNTIEVVELVKDGSFKLLQTISTLEDKETKSSGAAIKMSPDGKFVYVSNRGEDTIVGYKVEDNGLLTEIQRISTKGNHPRDFDISFDGDYVVVANMDSDSLTLYERSKDTGLLRIVQENVTVFEPVCVKFTK